MYPSSNQTRSTSASQGLNCQFLWQDPRDWAEADLNNEYLSFASSDNDSFRPRMSIGSAYSSESVPEQTYSYKLIPQYYQQQQNEVYKAQELIQVQTPYYRSHTSFSSSNGTCLTDYDQKIPSQTIFMEDYQSPSLPAFVVPQTYNSEKNLQPVTLVYQKHENYAGQAFQKRSNASPLLPSPTYQVNGQVESFKVPSQGLNMKSEVKQAPINNGIIEDDDEEDFEDGRFPSRFETYSQMPIVKEEITVQEQPQSTLFSVPLLPAVSQQFQPQSLPQPSKVGKPIKKVPKPKKKYKQSRQKNVFKNFGNAIMNCIQNNFVIRDLIEKRLEGNALLVEGFHDAFLSKYLNNLKNKEDFLQGWREKEHSDSEQFNQFRDVFKEISLVFFNEYAEKYVDESDKLKNKDIHIKAIPLFLKGILNVNELYKFKLS